MKLIGLIAISILIISFVLISTLTNANKPSLPSDEIITFNELAGKAGMVDMDFYSMQDQINLLKWSVENGYGEKWTCYKKLKREGKI